MTEANGPGNEEAADQDTDDQRAACRAGDEPVPAAIGQFLELFVTARQFLM